MFAPPALRRSLLLLGCLISAAATGAPVEFNLPEQSAEAALLEFSRQAKIEVLFPFDELQRQTSAPVAGRLEPDAAIARLLATTGFVAQRSSRGKFVVVAAPPRGAVQGRIMLPDSSPAPNVRVMVAGTRESATTDANGEFHFPTLPPARYRLYATGDGYQTLQINQVQVEANRTAALGVYTIQKANDPSRLAPFVVESETERVFNRERADSGPRLAGGNLDLRRTESGALPYTVYDRNQIMRSGVVNLNEFLQRELLDSDSSTRPPDQDGLEPTFSAGSKNLRLRGYEADETVILVNGRRLPEVLTTNAQPLPPDVNFIPLSLVQQVEVLPVSASALYSGNPVGGVINIVLRPSGVATATEVTSTYTNTLKGFDAPQSSHSLLHTRSLLDGALRLRFNASFAQSSPATEADLGFHQSRAPAPASLEAAIHRATPNVRSANLAPLFGPGTAPVTSVAPGADGGGGLAAFAGREGMPNLAFFDSPGGLAASLDSVDFPYGRRQRRTVFFVSAIHDMFPWLQVGLEGSTARTTVNRGYDVFQADLTLRADSPLNPFRRRVSVSLNEVAPQLGEDYSEARLDFSSLALGLLVKLPADWRLALDAQYARNLTSYRGVADADLGRWQELVDRGGYNPLRDTQVHGPPQAFYDNVLIYRGRRGDFVSLGDYSTWELAARGTNEALKLPTGLSTVNLGFDYRRNELAAFRDERRYGNGDLAAEPLGWTGRALRRYSAFGELQAPLFPAGRLPAWLRTVEADVAVRYVAADSSRESNVAPTFGLKVELANGVSFRGSLTTSNRFPTPSMNRLPFVPDGGTGPGLIQERVFDPVRNESYLVRVDQVLTPDLRAESAVTQTAGVMFRRGDLHRIRATLDVVDTRKVNELIFLEAGSTVGLEPLFPERIRRAPLQPGDPRRAGLITSVLTSTTNLAWRRSLNWNGALHYAWTDAFGGTLELRTRVLYFQRYDRQIYPNSPVVDELRQPDGTAPSLLKYRATFGAGWSNRDFGLGVDGHYFHSRVLPEREWTSQGARDIDAYWQFDAYLQSEIGRWFPGRFLRQGLRAQLRVNNLFDPPFPRYANSNSGVQPYGDWRGRVYSLSLTAAF